MEFNLTNRLGRTMSRWLQESADADADADHDVNDIEFNESVNT